APFSSSPGSPSSPMRRRRRRGRNYAGTHAGSGPRRRNGKRCPRARQARRPGKKAFEVSWVSSWRVIAARSAEGLVVIGDVLRHPVFLVGQLALRFRFGRARRAGQSRGDGGAGAGRRAGTQEVAARVDDLARMLLHRIILLEGSVSYHQLVSSLSLPARRQRYRRTRYFGPV